MLKNFIKKSSKFLAVLLTATLSFTPLSYATITGSNSGTDYTYSSNNSEDTIDTNKMFTGEYTVTLPSDPTNITTLQVEGTISGSNTTKWYNGLGFNIPYTDITIYKINLENSSSITAKSITISALSAESSITTNADNITTTNGISNNGGTITFTGGTNANAITSSGTTGTVIINGNVSTTASIANNITVYSGKSLTSNADYVGGAVTNSGTVNLTAGTLGQSITGGTVNVTGDVTSNASIASAITVNSGKSLTSNADYVDGAVTNNGTVNLTEGTLEKAITGGTVNVTGDVTSSASIASAITVKSEKSLTIGATNVEGEVTNNGTVNLTAGELHKDITGTNGTIVITGNVSTDASHLGNAVSNAAGTLTLNGGELAKVISGGTTVIDGTVSSSASIASAITVNSGKSLFIGAGNVGGAVDNSGDLQLATGTLGQQVSGSGTITTMGNVTTNANNLGNTVTNNNDFTLTAGTVTKEITGAGTTIIAGNVQSSTSIANAITINSGKSLFIGAGNVGGAVDNSGDLQLATGTLGQQVSGSGTITTMGNVVTNVNNIENTVTNNYDFTLTDVGSITKAIDGAGTTIIDGTIVSSAKIEQSEIKINSNKSLEISADNVGGNVSNEGKIKLGDGTLVKEITGAGTTEIDGNVVSSSSIANAMTVNSEKSLTISADNVDGTVANAGTLNLGAGTLEQAITGEGNIVTTGDVSSNVNNIGNTVTNDNVLTLTDTGTISKKITGTGTTIIDGDVVSSTSIANKITVNSTRNLTISADNIDGETTNAGTINLGAGTLEQNVLGDGNIITTDNVSVKNSTIENTIANEYELTLQDSTNIKGDISGTNGKLVVEASAQDKEITNSADISQYYIGVKKGIFNNTGTIESANASLTIDENGTLKSNAENITSYNNEILNDGNLTFTGGNNTNDVTGTGKLTVIGSSENQSGVEISQKELTVSDEFTNNGTISVEKINGTDTLTNNGDLNLNLKEANSYTLTNLTGTGDTNITVDTVNVTIDNTGKIIKQDTITTYGDKTLTLTGTGKVEADVINYMTGDCLDVATTIDGTLENYAITNIKTNGAVTGKITNTGTATDDAKLNILASTYDVQAGITGDSKSVSNNLLNVGDASNQAIVTSQTKIENQTITVSSGSVTLTGAGKISNSNLTIEENGSVFANAEKLDIINNEIINDGELVLVGTNVINENKIVNSTDDVSKGKVVFGDGTSNSIINKADIKQNEIDVLANTKLTNNNILISEKLDIAGKLINNNSDSNAIIVSGTDGITVSGTFTTNASAIETAKIANTGILNYTGGTNKTAVEGAGTLNVSGDLINNNTIAQTTVNVGQDITVTNNNAITTEALNIGTGSTFTTDIDNISKSGTEGSAITNAGNLVINADGTNKNTIAGTGTTQITNGATVTNTKGVSVSQKNLVIDNEATLEASAKDLTTTTALTNNGTLKFNQEGGADTNNNKIIGNGTIVIDNNTSLMNNSIISQKLVKIESGSGLATDVNKVVTETGILNNGLVTLTGSGLNSNVIAGEGALIFGDGTTTGKIINNSIIAQQKIVINANEDVINSGVIKAVKNGSGTNGDISIASNGSLTSDASSVITDNGIANYGGITFTGGTNTNAITGTGTTTINGDVISTAKISNAMTVNEEKSLTISASNIDGAVSNAGTVNLGTGTLAKAITGEGNIVTTGDVTTNANNLGNTVANDNDLTLTAGTIAKAITGTGTTIIDGTIVSNASIANEMTINASKSLTISADNVGGNVANAGTLNLGAGTLEKAITGAGNIVTTGNVVTNANNLGNTVENNYGLTLTAGTVTKAITGAGTTTIDGDVISNASIANSMIVNSEKSLTISADNVDGAVTNAGTLNLGAGTLEKAISGTGNIVTKGDVITDADNLGNTVANDYGLTLAAGTVTKAITGAGTTIIDGTIVSNASIANEMTINASKSLTISADNVDGAVANAGTLNLGAGTLEQAITGDGNIVTTGNVITDADNLGNTVANDYGLTLAAGTVTKAISGAGTTTIDGTVENNSSVSQNKVTVNNGGSFTTVADKITTTDGIANNGTLTFAGTISGQNNNVITGTGKLVTTSYVANRANITQSEVDINSGTFENEVGKTIKAQNINVAGGANFAVKAADLNVSGAINNAGTLAFAAGGDDTLSSKVEGDGITGIINGTNLTVDDTTINQKSITVESGSSLTSNINNVVTTDAITNSGTVTFTGNGENKNVIAGAGTLNLGDGTTVGTIINEKAITQNVITVADKQSLTNTGEITALNKITNAGTITTSATLLKTTNGIENSGLINLKGDGKNTNVITGTGTIDAIEGSLVNSAAITQNTINLKSNEFINLAGNTVTVTNFDVSSASSLTAIATDIVATKINNAGTVTFAGGTNNSEIAGTGKLVTTAALTNNAKITQKEVDINAGIFTNTTGKAITAQNINIAGGATLKGKAADLTTTGSINNAGVLEFNAGGADTLSSKVEGDGITTIVANGSTGTDLTVNSLVKQKAVVIDEKSSLTANANSIVTEYSIANKGNVTFTGGTNKNNVIGLDGVDGTLNITGSVINDKDAVISQKDINIAAGKSLELNNINNVTTTGKITNDGTLTIATTDGINNNVIDQTTAGILNVDVNLLNNASITQNTINVAKGKIFKTSADNLKADATGTIDLKGTDTYLVLEDDMPATLEEKLSGKGSLIKAGLGTLELTNDNEYTGTTTISDNGVLKITKKSNISNNTVYADGGQLWVAGDCTGTDQLVNTFTATENNDVNIMVGSGKTVELSGNINEASTKANFVKDGQGTMKLLMNSNTYTGDTLVDDGRLIGTTKNINNVVKGKSIYSGTVEFVDENDMERIVELNKIENIKLFEKTGDAIMNISKDFTVESANITNGEIIINNDLSQSTGEITCTGSKFNVVNDMTITNAILKGYANINATNIIVNNGATLSPGNSMGIVRDSGNLALNSGSIYDVEFTQFEMDKANADTDRAEELANDKTIVLGSATIDPDATLYLTNVGGKYYVKETYNLIEATGGLTGNYVDDLAHITFNDTDSADLRAGFGSRIDYTLTNDGNNLVLTAQRKASEYSKATEFTRSHNQNEVARAIDNVSTGFSGDIVNVLDQLEKYYYYNSTYDTAALKSALDDMSGMIYANTGWLTLINSKAEHVFDKIGDRTRTPDLLPCSKVHDRVWGEYYYNNFHTDANADSRKFDTQTNGFLVGFDMLTVDSWTMGVTAGYGESDLNQAKSDTSKMKDINLGFYGGYEGQKWVFKGMLLGGYEMYDTTRTIGFMNRQATSAHDGYSATAELEAGYKIALNPNSKKEHKLFLKPFVGLNGNYTTQNGFNEKGADSLNLSVDQHEAFTAQAKAGVGINGKAKAFEWYADAYAKKFLTDGYMEATTSLIDFPGATGMRIKSADMSSMTIAGRIGGDYNFDENWKIFANILASRSDTTRNYYGNIGVSYKFDCLTDKKSSKDDKDKEISMLKKEIKKLNRKIEEANKKLNVVSEQEAIRMKEKVVKQFKLESKPTFVFNSSELTQKGVGSLAEISQELNEYKNCEILVEGHTDNIGTEEYNQKLSEERAKAIAKALKENYDVKSKISIIGKGKKEPLTSNGTEEGREQNRRVEITVISAQN